MQAVRRVLKELYIGIAGCMVVFLIIGAFFVRPYWMYALALLVGTLAGVLRIYHMYDVLDQALDIGEGGAKKKVIVNSLLRMIVSAILLAGSIMISLTAFFGVTLGMIEPKLSAYLNPWIRKVLLHFGLEEPEEETIDNRETEPEA